MALLWFCAAGYSFYCGVALLLFSISLLAVKKQPRLFIRAAVVTAVIFIFLSAVALPLSLCIVWIVLSYVWFIFFNLGRYLKPFLFKTLSYMTIMVTLLVLILEISFWLKPRFVVQEHERLYIVGDSVSAGIGGKNEQTWPKLIGSKYGIEVVNLSFPGATVSSAFSQAESVPSKYGLVLLEIGGNDLFNSTPVAQFRKDLERMLEKICGRGHTVVMMELPLFPWQGRYGRTQRQLAGKFDVILIPKRFFVRVLSSKNSSGDLAHLSVYGHTLMADQIWSIIGPGMKTAARH